jgi:hypothetical protein
MKKLALVASVVMLCGLARAEVGQIQFPFSLLSTNSTVTNSVTQNVKGQVADVCVLFKGGVGTITGTVSVVGAQGQTIFSKVCTGPSTNWYSIRSPIITTAGANLQSTNAIPLVIDTVTTTISSVDPTNCSANIILNVIK